MPVYADRNEIPVPFYGQDAFCALGRKGLAGIVVCVTLNEGCAYYVKSVLFWRLHSCLAWDEEHLLVCAILHEATDTANVGTAVVV